MKSIQKLTLSGVFIGIGTITASLLHIPIGPIKAFPMQHLINVLSAIILGPAYAVGNAFCISVLRNLMGTGTLLAFPGSLFGALLASLLYKKFKNAFAAFTGEVVGTGLIGAYIAVLMLKGAVADVPMFFLAFAASSLIGAISAVLVYQILSKTPALKKQIH